MKLTLLALLVALVLIGYVHLRPGTGSDGSQAVQSSGAFTNEGVSGTGTQSAVRTCVASRTKVDGYLHPSSHGAWVSDDPGLNSAGVVIGIDRSSKNEGLGEMLNFLRDVAKQDEVLFFASFTGVISCRDGKRRLVVQEVSNIQKTELADAASAAE